MADQLLEAVEKPPSHDDLMAAVVRLSAAAQAEMNAGSRKRAAEINALSMAAYSIATRDAD